MRNWFAMSGATAHLERKSMEYIPTYRTPAGQDEAIVEAVAFVPNRRAGN